MTSKPDPPPPRLVVATPENYPVIADIYNHYIRAGTATMEETEKSAQAIAQWVEGFNDRERLFVVTAENAVIGWAIIKRYSDREGYRFACETAVYLEPSQTGKGYGPMIKSWIIDQCRELGYRHLVAKIFATNTASIQYNLKIGYEIVGKQNRIGYKDGTWIDIVIMQLVIE